MTDVEAVVELAHERGALVLLDAYQTVGSLPVDVKALGVDFLAAGVLKYLLGSAGLAFFYCRRELFERAWPTATGWFADRDIFEMDVHDYSPSPTARRFQSGTPPIPAIYAGIAGIELMQEIGIAETREHVLGLNEQLIAGVEELGGSIVTPRDPRPSRCVDLRSVDRRRRARSGARARWDRHLLARRQPARLRAQLQLGGRHPGGCRRARPSSPSAGLTMEQRALGRTGLTLSRLGLGCGNFGGSARRRSSSAWGRARTRRSPFWTQPSSSASASLDTADAYGGGRSETWIGRWRAARGAPVLLSTKVFHSVEGDPSDRGLSRERILRQIDGSLARLGVDRVDMYLIHAPDPDTPLNETLGALDELVRAGKVGAVGASNVDRRWLEEASKIAEREKLARIGWVQNSYSLLDRDAETDVLPLCAERGLGFTPFGPLAGGWLTGKYRRGETAPPGSRMSLKPGPYTHLDREGGVPGARRLRGGSRAARRRHRDPRDRLDAVPSGRHGRDRRPQEPAPPGAGPGRPRAEALPRRASRARVPLRRVMLVLSETDVERLLPMEECIEVMEEALASLARGELYQPLRSVVRPPEGPGSSGSCPRIERRPPLPSA